MPFGSAESGFWFYGRLGPAAEVPRFSAQTIEVEPGAYCEIVWDGIAVWARPGTTSLKTLEDAELLLTLTVGAYALLRRTAYDVRLDGWIEAEGASLTDSYIGFMSERREPDLIPRVETEQDADMRQAVLLAAACRTRPWYRLALRDLHAAFRDRGDDGFLFAYRAVEDVCRAVSGREAELEPGDWERLIMHLGSDADSEQARIALLKQARHGAAHGDVNRPELARARQQRNATLTIARDIVAEAIAADPQLPLTGDQRLA